MNQDEAMHKITTGKTRFWIRVLAVGIIFSVTSFLILLDFMKEYKASTSILVVPKTEISSGNLESTVSNLAEFPKMFTFYDRLVRTNNDFKDPFAGKSKDDRKNMWNNVVESSVSDSAKGSIINVSVYAENSSKADILIKKTVKNLLEMTAEYYVGDQEVQIATLDGPIISAVFRRAYASALIAVLVGLLTSLVLNGMLQALEASASLFFSGRQRIKNLELERGVRAKSQEKESAFNGMPERYNYDVPYDFGNIGKNQEQSKPINGSILEEYGMQDFSDNPYPNYPEMPTARQQEWSVPENLPVAEYDTMPRQETVETEVEQKKEEQTFVEMKRGEPTAEELRDRLNKLLKGDI